MIMIRIIGIMVKMRIREDEGRLWKGDFGNTCIDADTVVGLDWTGLMKWT